MQTHKIQKFLFAAFIIKTIFYSNIGLSVEIVCHANSFIGFQQCLEKKKNLAEDSTLIIRLMSNLVLRKDEVIRFKDMHHVQLVGALGGNVSQKPSISEDKERLLLDTQNNRHLIEIVGNSHHVTLTNLVLNDLSGSENLLKTKCRTGANSTNPNLWDPPLCYSPILVGGNNSNKTREITENILINSVVIRSHKALLAEIRSTNLLSIKNSVFDGGTVTGLFFNAAYRRWNTLISSTTFKHSGTAALTLTNAFNSLIINNLFLNNHIDPQYPYIDPNTGETKYYPGGQLYLASVSNAPIQYVKILNNEITSSPEYLGKRMTAGIEVMTGELSPISDVLISGNKIHGISRHAMSIHYSKSGQHRNILIKGNHLYSNLLDYPELQLPETAYIQTETIIGHPGVNLDSNFYSKDTINSKRVFYGSLDGTQTSCRVDPKVGLCKVILKWKYVNLPEGSKPILRVNGKPMAFIGGKTSGEMVLPWIKADQTYVVSIHTNENNMYPLASTNIFGK